jgi:DNA (cytosine-5)-methyltransferase 1
MQKLDLFTGCGGGVLGSALAGVTTVGYVEINEYRQRVIAQRIRDGLIDNAPIFGDIRAFVREGYARAYRGLVDAVAGGDPCQCNSNAHRYGKTADSYAEWFLEVVREAMPIYVVRENPAKTRRDAPWPAERFADALESMGYSATCVEIRACCLGADHQRARLFVLGELADTYGQYVTQRMPFTSDRPAPQTPHARGVLATDRKTNHARVRGKSDAVARRMERLKALGDGQVPAVVAAAWRLLTARETER